eukprot:1144552-Pelagomonas_calceolata.AAC.2
MACGFVCWNPEPGPPSPLICAFTHLQNHYVERLYRLYLYCAPMLFYGLWKVIAPLVGPLDAKHPGAHFLCPLFDSPWDLTNISVRYAYRLLLQMSHLQQRVQQPFVTPSLINMERIF